MSWREVEPGIQRPIRWREILEDQTIRVSGTPGHSRGTFFVRLAAGISLTIMSALFSSWVHVQNINVRYQLSQKLRVQQELILSRDQLEIQRQMLRSPTRITKLAEERFQFRLPEVAQKVILK